MHRNRQSPEKRSEQLAANLASRLSEQSSAACELLLWGQWLNHLNKLGQNGGEFSRLVLVGWGMADGLVGWLADLLVSESHGCLFGRSSWSVLWLVGWLVGWLNNQMVIGR